MTSPTAQLLADVAARASETPQLGLAVAKLESLSDEDLEAWGALAERRARKARALAIALEGHPPLCREAPKKIELEAARCACERFERAAEDAADVVRRDEREIAAQRERFDANVTAELERARDAHQARLDRLCEAAVREADRLDALFGTTHPASHDLSREVEDLYRRAEAAYAALPPSSPLALAVLEARETNARLEVRLREAKDRAVRFAADAHAERQRLKATIAAHLSRTLDTHISSFSRTAA